MFLAFPRLFFHLFINSEELSAKRLEKLTKTGKNLKNQTNSSFARNQSTSQLQKPRTKQVSMDYKKMFP